MLRGELARLSLTYVQMVAGFAGLSKRPLAWRRTPKFAGQARGLGAAFRTTLPETIIGSALLLLALAPLLLVERIGIDMAGMIAIGAGSYAMAFFAAPAMAWLSERRLAEASAPLLNGGELGAEA